jgi:hypothetical protein
MQKITSAKELRYAIETLEADQIMLGLRLKDQIYIAGESLRPVNIVKRNLKAFTSSQFLGDNIPGAILGLVSGYLSGRIFTGASVNIFRKLLGSLLRVGVTAVVAKKSDSIKSAGMTLVEHFFHKKILNSKSNAR